MLGSDVGVVKAFGLIDGQTERTLCALCKISESVHNSSRLMHAAFTVSIELNERLNLRTLIHLIFDALKGLSAIQPFTVKETMGFLHG